MAKESNRSTLFLPRNQLVCFALSTSVRGARHQLSNETIHSAQSIQSTSKALLMQQGISPLFVFIFVRLMKEDVVENKQGSDQSTGNNLCCDCERVSNIAAMLKIIPATTTSGNRNVSASHTLCTSCIGNFNVVRI